jgi:hypothetical protein
MRGQPGKNAQRKALAAQAEHQISGNIESIRRTQHGESRFPKAEKYDLGNGYRLVCRKRSRAPLGIFPAAGHFGV